MNKKELRKKYLAVRESMGPIEVEEKSSRIMEALTGTRWFEDARVVMTYLSIRGEVDTWGIARKLLETGKRLVVPITHLQEKRLLLSEVMDMNVELNEGTFGIMEPKEEYYRPIDRNSVDLILVPGLVFDEKGYRIGYGGGFYDRLLQDIDHRVKVIGVAYDYQVLQQLTPEFYDQSVNAIITEERIIMI